MKKNTLLIVISILSIILLMLSQIAWIHLLVEKDKDKLEIELNKSLQSILSFALSKEVGDNPSGKLSIELVPLDPSTIPEDAIMKGSFDTKEYNSDKNIGTFLVGMYAEELLSENKIRIEPIDSLFRKEFSSYSQIEAYTMSFQKGDSTLRKMSRGDKASYLLKNKDKGFTIVLPIGDSGKYSFKAHLLYKPTLFTRQMRSLSIVSAFAIILISLLMIYQLYRLKRKSDELITHKKVVNGIIHDLKSPLAYVFTQLGVFEKIENDIEKKKKLEISKIRVKYLSDKIEMLLSALRGKGNKLELKVSYYAFNQKCKEMMDELSVIYRNKQINYTIEPLEEIIIKADPVYFDACVRNLLDNALKYSGDNPIIHVRAEQNKDEVRITFADNGKGISENEMKKVFYEFYRAETDASLKSHGIGLAFTKQIIQAHSGKISLDSTLGKGSIFTIILPQ